MKSHIDLVILDWGIGGLSVYNEVRKINSKISILYFSDSGQMPYGKMKKSELHNRLFFLISNLAKTYNVKKFIIACNAASTALPGLKIKFSKLDLQVVGVIEQGIKLIHFSKCKNIGVIGGRRTILSRQLTRPYYQTKSKKVTGRIAQPLSALIEKGELDTARMHDTLKVILKPVRHCDALVLACTHYPAISEQIKQHLPFCQLLDPARDTALYVHKNWKFKSNKKISLLFLTSGKSINMIRSAKLAFKTTIPKVLEV